MQSKWDRINQNKNTMDELNKNQEGYLKDVDDTADKIKQLLNRMSDANLGTPEDIKELSGLFGRYHAKKSMQTLTSMSISTLSMTGGLILEKQMAHHNLVCPEDKMLLIPHGYFSEIRMPKGSDFETRSEYDEAVEHYDQCMSNYSEFSEGKTPEELVEMKGYFVCPDCGRVYRIENVGKDGRENSKVVSLYNAIKKELSR